MLDSTKGFNTLTFEHSQIPSLRVLNDAVSQFKPPSLASIANSQINVRTKPEILAILTIPIGPSTANMFPREIALNLQTILKYDSLLVSTDTEVFN
jgi:hypothetical protein